MFDNQQYTVISYQELLADSSYLGDIPKKSILLVDIGFF